MPQAQTVGKPRHRFEIVFRRRGKERQEIVQPGIVRGQGSFHVALRNEGEGLIDLIGAVLL